ncbi:MULTISPECIES: CynX/NimT family MFS transporter [unclassified Pseudomonas]|uniref:CynX/NimT family MFS transporter n=1 Tax=unclassified Pseudomonas TaxID=196821 RepID=UPI000731B237|nr:MULTISPECIES: CynX/NimT family MFS transporter [unclassified Pseudomonas]KSW22696.1 MFS transporter [Pseudomonas sp. ADP]OBP11327.1 MFS transporter [Pseudomonas sp. EGD-AKN5]QOF85513.1 CynX/NimT family MFS transporter [Pseudomonas sp. ADPe]
MPQQHHADELLIDAEIDEAPAPTPAPVRPWLLLLGLVLVALNLRPALSSLAPLLNTVREHTGLSAAAAGLLTTLPVLCLGLFAPLAPRLARRLGAERAVLAILLLLAAGIVLRSLFPIAGLFLGSLVAGASIGIIGVLLPGIVKRDFPHIAGIMTGVYTMALCLGAALAAGASVPLAELFGDAWQPALAAWALPAVLAALVWLPQTRQAQHAHRQAFQVRGLWRDPLAWQVTLYMGLQSSLAYIVFGWLPSILIDRGLSPTAAGLMMSGSVMVQLLSALGAPWFGTRGRDQRLVVFLVLALTLAGLLGLLYAPGGSLWLWAVVLGLGQGGTFSIGLALIVLRSPDAHVASHLSGMAQGVGYTLAALGPFLVGLVHDLSDGWNAVGVIFIAISLGALVAGLGAGRDRLVGVRSEALS